VYSKQRNVTDPLNSHEIKVLLRKSECAVGEVSHFKDSGRTPFRFRKTLFHRLGALTAMAAGIAAATPQTFIHVCKGMFLRQLFEHL